MASVKRFISTIRITTASSFIVIVRKKSGRGTLTVPSRCPRTHSISTRSCARQHRRPLTVRDFKRRSWLIIIGRAVAWREWSEWDE